MLLNKLKPFLVFYMVWSFCMVFSNQSSSTEKIGVAVTILPQKEFVEAVGKENVEVTVMVPPGANPHSFEPRPSQLVNLSRARAYVKVGTPIEFELSWMDNLLKLNQKMKVIDMSNGVELLKYDGMFSHNDQQHSDTGIDPHVWLSLKSLNIQIKNICDGLIGIDNQNADFYKKNMESYLAQVRTLIDYMENGLKKVHRKEFMVFHPSFGYFAKDFGLTQIPIEVEGQEPTARELVRLVEEARKMKINVIFVEPQFSTKSSKVIASQIGGRVVPVDTLAENYLQNMKAMGDTFFNDLK
jgi:zinc transport system substrate-binding protein